MKGENEVGVGGGEGVVVLGFWRSGVVVFAKGVAEGRGGAA